MGLLDNDSALHRVKVHHGIKRSGYAPHFGYTEKKKAVNNYKAKLRELNASQDIVEDAVFEMEKLANMKNKDTKGGVFKGLVDKDAGIFMVAEKCFTAHLKKRIMKLKND